jgi:putative ABC transport system permease protein
MIPSGPPSNIGGHTDPGSGNPQIGDAQAGMVPVARRNLLAEKGRLAMSVAGVAFATLLVLIIVSLYRGWGGASQLFDELPGDLWISQEGTSDPFRSTSALPDDRLAALQSIPGVAFAIPVYTRRVAVGREDTSLSVFFMALAAPRESVPAAARERFFPEPGHVIIDSVLAGDAGVRSGGRLGVLGREFVVERIVSGGNPIFEVAFLSAEDGIALLGKPGYTSFYLLGLGSGADLDAVATDAVGEVPGSEAHTSEQYAQAMRDVVAQGFLPVVGTLVTIGLVIGGAVIALTTYTATIERARDFGVLKAVGASNGFVYRIVVVQSLTVGVVGAAAGVVASVLAATLIKRGVPEFVTDLRWTDATAIFAAAVVVSIAAAYVPVHRINRIDPAMVFRA